MTASYLAPTSDRRAQPAESGHASARLAGLRALIVEDEMFVAWHMEEILERLDIEVCAIAPNAQTAVERAVQIQPDIVLMDVNLGRGPDGIQAARDILPLTGARFLFVTAYSDPDLSDRVEDAAPSSRLLQKPVTPAMIEAALVDLFG